MLKQFLAVPLLIASTVVAAAECNTELKPTDGYKELSAKLKCLAGELATLRKEVIALKGPPPTAGKLSSAGPALKPAASATVGHYSLDLTNCVRVQSTLTCSLKITSAGKDGTVAINSESSFYDNLGREYRVRTVSLAEKTGAGTSKDLIRDIPISAVLRFDGLDEQVTSIPSIRLNFFGAEVGVNWVSLRNISIASNP